jgi:putative hydrolase of the HAD superfamily
MRFADIDAVTVDAYGTLLTLRDPVPALAAALSKHGVDRERADVERAFRAEVVYYAANKLAARDRGALVELRRACAAVFLEAAGASLPVAAFEPDFTASLVFEPLPGAVEALERLRGRGLPLALVANWDTSLRDHLRDHRLDAYFTAVVISAEVGAAKPDPKPFLLAVEALGVSPDRTVHVGDSEDDEAGARAAGLLFAWAPLAEAVGQWS